MTAWHRHIYEFRGPTEPPRFQWCEFYFRVPDRLVGGDGMPDAELEGFDPADDEENDSTEGPEDPDAVYEEDG